MAGLIDDLGFKRVDVMGYHTGSQTAMEIARQRPDLVQDVVMVSAPLYTVGRAGNPPRPQQTVGRRGGWLTPDPAVCRFVGLLRRGG